MTNKDKKRMTVKDGVEMGLYKNHSYEYFCEQIFDLLNYHKFDNEDLESEMWKIFKDYDIFQQKLFAEYAKERYKEQLDKPTEKNPYTKRETIDRLEWIKKVLKDPDSHPDLIHQANAVLEVMLGLSWDL